MTTEERLEHLERELARAKRRNRWLVAGLVLCLGALVVVWARGTPGRYALTQQPRPQGIGPNRPPASGCGVWRGPVPAPGVPNVLPWSYKAPFRFGLTPRLYAACNRNATRIRTAPTRKPSAWSPKATTLHAARSLTVAARFAFHSESRFPNPASLFGLSAFPVDTRAGRSILVAQAGAAEGAGHTAHIGGEAVGPAPRPFRVKRRPEGVR